MFQERPESFLERLKSKFFEQKQLKKEDISQLVSERDLARKNKNFPTADKIRKQLDHMGIEVRDSPKGTQWDIKITV